MTARPIIFSAPMIRALIDGRKTQTRRVLRKEAALNAAAVFDREFLTRPGNVDLIGCAIGDRLWVRESFALGFDLDDHDMPIGDEPKLFFAATYDGRRWLDRDTDEWRDEPRWTPSIHMPRWASRLTLVVTGVKVERLQEISEADAKAEGAIRMVVDDEAKFYERDDGTFKCGFAGIWSHIHGLDSWDANPWIVAVSFVTHMRNIDHE